MENINKNIENKTAVQYIVDEFKNTYGKSVTDILLVQISKALQIEKEQNKITEDTSDGYHTFKELYEFRKMYNAALFNEWGNYEFPTYNVHKSWRHNDGELCFGGGWFIVCAELPDGLISNHYKAEDWELFKIPEKEKALFPFDGHTSQDVLLRIKSLIQAR